MSYYNRKFSFSHGKKKNLEIFYGNYSEWNEAKIYSLRGKGVEQQYCIYRKTAGRKSSCGISFLQLCPVRDT